MENGFPKFKLPMPLKTLLAYFSLPYQILIASLLGVIMGWLLGDQAAIFQPGSIYKMLLQVVAIPYIICTLLTSLSLTPSLSIRFFKKSWIFYLFLLILTFSVLLILGKAIPLNLEVSET